MNIISFAWTSPAVRALQKSCTRREWKIKHASKFHQDDLVNAATRQLQYGGEIFGIIRLTLDPYEENTRDIPDEDYEKEGFLYLSKLGVKVDGLTPKALWRAWKIYPRVLWVIRFEVVEIYKD